MTKTLWDDEYGGPRWRYAFLLRPLHQGFPEGAIGQSSRPHPDYPHGTLDWPRPLTDHEVYTWELKLVEVLEGEPDNDKETSP